LTGFSPYPTPIVENVPGIYIHVPFCVSKCPYCNFYSLPAEESLMDAYTEQLLRALDEAAAIWNKDCDSLYFGGGTPILLGDRRIGRIIERAREKFGLDGAEITLEANPASALENTLRGLFAAGVNRLSFGLQSADETELRLLGRRHTAKEAADAVRHAQQAGFSNISLDLMLALPGQSEETVRKSIDFCAETGVSHISSYLLKVEEGTPFYADGVALRCPDEDRSADLYLAAVEHLQKRGFLQYEISNFAKDGFHSRHNCKYWLGAEYLGLGPAAHSMINGRRMYFPRDLRGFLAAEHPLSLMVDDGVGGSAEEYALLGLRLCQGIEKAAAKGAHPAFDWDGLWKKAAVYQKAGYLRLVDEHLAFTPEGFLLSNAVLARIL